MPQGYLCLVLHAHLPYVRHPEYDKFLEEDWLFEAITETYVPLWQILEGLVRDSVPFRLTMSMTPTLCAMLNDSLLRERYLGVQHIQLRASAGIEARFGQTHGFLGLFDCLFGRLNQFTVMQEVGIRLLNFELNLPHIIVVSNLRL